MKYIFCATALFTGCSFQCVPNASATSNYWERLGTSVSQGLTPDITFDPNGKLFAVIYIREWSSGTWNLVGGVKGNFADSPSLNVNNVGQPVVAWHEQHVSGATVSNPVVYISGS